MKTIGIYIDRYWWPWDHNNIEEGMGGSETWAYEVSAELARKGYDVTLYAYPPQNYEPIPHLNIVNYELYFHDIKYRRYDYFIYSRYVDEISPYLKCDNVYVIAHDVCLLTPQNQPLNIGIGKVKKYCYLSEWHKNNLLDLYKDVGLNENLLYKVSNGFSRQYYNDIDLDNKENSMVWSSSIQRGFMEFYKYVYLPILKEVPDFKVYVCCGTMTDVDRDMIERACMLPGVEVLGKLSKKKLAEYQKKSKIWIYPGTFAETFCITAVENAAAGNFIISPLSFGLKTTLDGIDYVNDMDIQILSDNTAQLFINNAIKSLTDDNYRKKCVIESMEKSKEYSWERAADEFIKLFESELS